MTRQIIYLIILLNSLVGNVFASEIKDKAESIIKTSFSDIGTLKFQKYSLPQVLKIKLQKQVKQVFFRNEVYLWKVKDSDSTLGYALLDNVIGKALPITFLVTFSTSLKIKDVAIIKYRETIGGEISNKNWTRQFQNKDISSGYKIGTDIDGISGATMSVISVTKGVEKLTRLLGEIKDSI